MRHVPVVFAVIFLLVCGGCSDSGDPSVDDFRLTIDVVDTEQQPVEGLEVKLHVPIPEVMDWYGVAKPSCAIEFICPKQDHATITIYDLAGEQVRLLFRDTVLAGRFRVVFDGADDEGTPLVGTHVLRCELIAHDTFTGDVLYEHSEWMTLYTAIDYDQRPVLGFTDTVGRVVTLDNLLVPFLHDLPELRGYDETAEPIGPFTIPDVVTVTLTDTLSGVRQDFDFKVEPGANHKSLVWNPTVRFDESPTAAAVPVVTAGGKSVDVDPIPAEWRLWPSYPNPFN